MKLPLCKCGCGFTVTKPKNQYLNGHYKKRYNKAWNKGIKFSNESRQKMSESAIKKFKENPHLRKKCGWKKYTYKKFIKEYDFLLQKEECRKYKNTFQFRCKYCNKWFTPTSEQLYYRISSIKHKQGFINSYLYCSDDCKSKCRLYNRHSDPDEFNKLQEYRMMVYRYTAKSISEFGYLIKDLNKRSLEFELDHKYSIYEGFKNKINPKIIGCYKNLQILTKKENLKKGIECSITKEELIKNNGDL